MVEMGMQFLLEKVRKLAQMAAAEVIGLFLERVQLGKQMAAGVVWGNFQREAK